MVLNKAQVEPEAGKGPKKRSPDFTKSIWPLLLDTQVLVTSPALYYCLFDSHMPAEEESLSPIYANHPWLSFEVNFQFESVNYSIWAFLWFSYLVILVLYETFTSYSIPVFSKSWLSMTILYQILKNTHEWTDKQMKRNEKPLVIFGSHKLNILHKPLRKKLLHTVSIYSFLILGFWFILVSCIIKELMYQFLCWNRINH